MKKLTSILVLLAIACFAIQAQDLISVADLSKKLMDKNTIIVSARPDADYKTVHIRNAVNVPYSELQSSDGIKGLLKSPADIAKILGDAGISADKTIVVYDEGSGKYAGRLYWILKYMGAPDVKMLDGNLEAWKVGRKPVTKAMTFSKKTTFTPNINTSILANMSDVAAGTAVLVDVREATEFKGLDGKSKGHIKGAINMEYKEVLNADGTMKTKAELASLFAASGIKADTKVILYCSTSVRAGVAFLALHSVLGYSNIKVYDGAYNEWEVKQPDKIVK